jgi:hypothetical protein
MLGRFFDYSFRLLAGQKVALSRPYSIRTRGVLYDVGLKSYRD